MRFRFSEVFQENPDNTITPKRNIRIRGAIFGPQVTFGPGVSFGGINIFDFRGLGIEADEEGDILNIRGFYRV
jgi:hypothetical protein